MTTLQRLIGFAKYNGFNQGYPHDVFYKNGYEIGHTGDEGKLFYGPLCSTNHFRKEVDNLHELSKKLNNYCGLETSVPAESNSIYASLQFEDGEGLPSDFDTENNFWNFKDSSLPD